MKTFHSPGNSIKRSLRPSETSVRNFGDSPRQFAFLLKVGKNVLIRTGAILLLALHAALPTKAESVTLAWDPNTEPDLAKYIIYYTSDSTGTQSVEVIQQTTVTVSNLLPGNTYRFHATAKNTAGVESEPSNVVEWTIPSANQPPSLLPIASQTTPEDTAKAIPVSVSDTDTDLSQVVITASSSNTSLVPNANLLLTGAGSDRVLNVLPLAGQHGQTTISLTATDGLNQTTIQFSFTVVMRDDSPILPAIASQSMAEDTAITVFFSISDPDTALASVTTTASSSNQSLIPNSSLITGGFGSSRSLTLVPQPNQHGAAAITVQATDGVTTVSQSFTVTVSPVNDAPALAPIASVVTNEDVPSSVNVSVNDVDTSLSSVIVTASSSNLTLLPLANIAVTGSGSSRTLSLAPAPNQHGVTTITVTADDGSARSSVAFTLTVSPVNDAPILSSISNQSTQEDTAASIAFTVTDADSNLDGIVLAATSSNPSLLPNENIILSGSGSARSVTLTPAPDQHGATTITITANDGVNQTPISFVLSVNPVDDPSTLSAIPNQSAQEDSVHQVPFTLADPDTDLSSIALSASSSNPSLVAQTGLSISGAGANRILSITPLLNQTGKSTINLRAGTGINAASVIFEIEFLPVNDAPVLSSIPTQNLAKNGSITVNFTLTDDDTPIEKVSLMAWSSNTRLIPNATGLVLGGSGTSRTLTITPVRNKTGSTLVTLIADDSLGAASRTFKVVISDSGKTTLALAENGAGDDQIPINVQASPEYNGNRLQLAWYSLPGQSYKIVATDDIASNHWVSKGEVQAEDEVSSWSEHVPAEIRTRFYKVIPASDREQPGATKSN